jgi:hypothetical protein
VLSDRSEALSDGPGNRWVCGRVREHLQDGPPNIKLSGLTASSGRSYRTEKVFGNSWLSGLISWFSYRIIHWMRKGIIMRRWAKAISEFLFGPKREMTDSELFDVIGIWHRRS